MLLARRFASWPLVCLNRGADRRIVAFMTEATTVQRILSHLGEPAAPPRISPARRPPAWDDPPARPYRTGTPWPHRHPGTSSTSKRSGSRLPSPGRAGDAPLPAPAMIVPPASRTMARQQARPAPSQTAACSPSLPVGSRRALAENLASMLRSLDPGRRAVGFPIPIPPPRGVAMTALGAS